MHSSATELLEDMLTLSRKAGIASMATVGKGLSFYTATFHTAVRRDQEGDW